VLPVCVAGIAVCGVTKMGKKRETDFVLFLLARLDCA